MLGGPTLIELAGRHEPPLFVSVLQHGNEDSGFRGMQQVLRACQGKELPRSLMLLVANVSAAREGLRRLDGQPDYNRVWPGTVEHRDRPEAAIMAEVYERVIRRKAFAAIDLHNNTGLNPHYGVICSRDDRTMHLAALFSRIAVWFRGLEGTQTHALAGQVPAIAAECGQPGVAANAEAAASLVEAVLRLSAFPDHPVPPEDLDLYHTLAIARVRPELSISFAGEEADLCFAPDLDRLNFRELAAGTRFGRSSHPAPLEVRGEDGEDVSASFFAVEDGALTLQRDAMPAMLTREERIVRQDCLCYLMERLAPGEVRGVSFRSPA